MEIVFGVIVLFVVYLLIETCFRWEDIRRFLLEQIETYALSAFRFAAQRNANVADGDRKVIMALSSRTVIGIAQRLSSVSLLHEFADGCIDDDVRVDILALAESTKHRGRRALLAKTQRTQRMEKAQE